MNLNVENPHDTGLTLLLRIFQLSNMNDVSDNVSEFIRKVKKVTLQEKESA